MPRKIDPLNKKLYGSVTAMLTVTDVKAAAAFYQKAFGFAKRGIMNGPDGKAIHAELTLRGTTLMLGPEMPQMGARSAKTLGRLTGEFVSAHGECRQGGCQSRKARSGSQGTGDGYVLGRPLWDHSRPRWLHVDGCYPYCRTDSSGNEKENEGANGQPTGRHSEWLLIQSRPRHDGVR